jgi:lipoprotein-anchoring transpeptidase ErfK/SrfK
MRLLALVAFLLMVFQAQAQAQVYEPFDRYDDYDPYFYDEPYGPGPPPLYDEQAPRYREPPRKRWAPLERSSTGTIVIMTRRHTLTYTTSRGEQFAYRIAVGRQGKQWYGATRVVSKREHPEWRPTAGMRQKNPRLPVVVGPGPSNPLGTRAIYLADGLLRIHGTNDPSSIGTNASSGCFRMYRQDVEELYEMVQPGTKVVVRR